MNKVYLFGDVHGQYKYIRDFVNNCQVQEDDTIILLGDAGFNFYFNHRDEEFKKKVNKLNITFFVIRGNHEERPSNCMAAALDEWELSAFWENLVYVEKKYPNIKYALDCPAKYLIPTAQGIPIKTLVLPGAYSVDKYYRIQNGLSWFKDEQCTPEEMDMGIKIAKSVPIWDLILSHTCPVSFEPSDLFLSYIDQSTVDKTTEYWLNDIELNTIYSLWVFAHYHKFRIYPKYNEKQIVMLFNDNALDLYKYFCGKYPIDKSILKI